MSRILITLLLITLVATIAITPFLARLGSTKRLVEWTQPAGISYVKRPVTLAILEDVAWVDVFKQYPQYRLIISDGSYRYTREFGFNETPSQGYLKKCHVEWTPEGVQLAEPNGERLFVPTKIIVQRIGNN